MTALGKLAEVPLDMHGAWMAGNGVVLRRSAQQGCSQLGLSRCAATGTPAPSFPLCAPGVRQIFPAY